ncbi:MAG: hypothetical protein PVG32_11140 [Anaerolineales bacterium]|jgi:hypothetical protein
MMINWFVSLNSAITFSVIAMLSFTAYALLESRYFLEQWIPGITAAALETLFVLVVLGIWIWALLTAVGGHRGALITSMILSGISGLIALFDLIRYSPIPHGWPLLQIGVWVLLCASVLSITSGIVYLL